jgi:hypothetical protein
VRITESLPETGYTRPDAASMVELLAIVQKNEWIDLNDVTVDEFRRAMHWTGHVFRLPPGEVYGEMYFPAWVDVCNNFLNSCDLRDINGAAVIAGIIGQGDIDYILESPRHGQKIALGINRYIGRSCSNFWRLLNRSPLRAPLPPRGIARHQTESIPKPRHFAEIGGRLREFDPGKSEFLR